MMRRDERTRGLTLLELLVATFVLCVGILGVLAALPTVAAGSNRVESTLEGSDAARAIADALREGARGSTHVVWEVAPDGRRTPRSVYLLLPYAPAGAGGAAEPGVFGERCCLLLPHGTDKVFTYPRAGDAAEIARKNGGGDAGAAVEAVEPEDVFALAPDAGEEARGTSFAIRVQRARVAGQPRDGLYRFAVHVYRGQTPGELPLPAKQVATLATELFVGPHDGLDVGVPPTAPGGGGPLTNGPGGDPRDWLQLVQRRRADRINVPSGEGPKGPPPGRGPKKDRDR